MQKKNFATSISIEKLECFSSILFPSIFQLQWAVGRVAQKEFLVVFVLFCLFIYLFIYLFFLLKIVQFLIIMKCFIQTIIAHRPKMQPNLSDTNTSLWGWFYLFYLWLKRASGYIRVVMNKSIWRIHSILAHPDPSPFSFLRGSSHFLKDYTG